MATSLKYGINSFDQIPKKMDWGYNPATSDGMPPVMFGQSPADSWGGVADWTEGASTNLGKGGFTGLGLDLTKENPSWMDALGKYGPELKAATGLVGTGLGAYLGLKQFGLAQDIFNEQKNQVGLTYSAQRDSFNNQVKQHDASAKARNPEQFASSEKLNRIT